MKTFGKEHEEKLAVELLTHALTEAQMSPDQLPNTETFSSDRAKFLIRALAKTAARALACLERIVNKDLHFFFNYTFDLQLEYARKALEEASDDVKEGDEGS